MNPAYTQMVLGDVELSEDPKKATTYLSVSRPLIQFLR